MKTALLAGVAICACAFTAHAAPKMLTSQCTETDDHVRTCLGPGETKVQPSGPRVAAPEPSRVTPPAPPVAVPPLPVEGQAPLVDYEALNPGGRPPISANHGPFPNPPGLAVDPPALGWIYQPYMSCVTPPTCTIITDAAGLNVRTAPNGPPIMSLANGTPVIPLRPNGNWVLVTQACNLVPTWLWSWNAGGVPLMRCWW